MNLLPRRKARPEPGRHDRRRPAPEIAHEPDPDTVIFGARADVDYDTSYDHNGWDEDSPAARLRAGDDPARVVETLTAGIGPVPPMPQLFAAEVAGRLMEADPGSAEVLARVREGLLAMDDGPAPIALIMASSEDEPPAPGAFLRAIMPGVQHPWDALTGLPCFAGVTHTPDGRPQAGIYLGDEDEDGRHVLDVQDAGWLRALAGAALEALAALETGRPWPGPGIAPLEFLGGALFDALADGRGDEHRIAAYEAALALLVPAVFPAPVAASVNGALQ